MKSTAAIPKLSLPVNIRKRKLLNIVWCGAIYGAAATAISILIYIFGFIVYQGLPALNLSFFLELPRPVGEVGGGMANALMGTITLVLTASLMGIPVGILTGIYLSEYGRGRWATIVRFSCDLLTSVPSIVIGLFAYALIVLPMGHFSALAGSVALAAIMVPSVARTTEELLKLVPTHIREAGLALGLPRWKVILQIVVRGSMGGITTGLMLAVARIAGETAPLIFTALNNSFWQRGLMQPIASLPVQIYTYAIAPFEEWHRQAWAGAFVLVVFVFVVNVITRLVIRPSAGSRE